MQIEESLRVISAVSLLSSSVINQDSNEASNCVVRVRIAFSGLVDNRRRRPPLARIERIAQSKRTRRMKVEFLTHTDSRFPLPSPSLCRGEILSLPTAQISLKWKQSARFTKSNDRWRSGLRNAHAC